MGRPLPWWVSRLSTSSIPVAAIGMVIATGCIANGGKAGGVIVNDMAMRINKDAGQW
jgi:hypothetical protein